MNTNPTKAASVALAPLTVAAITIATAASASAAMPTAAGFGVQQQRLDDVGGAPFPSDGTTALRATFVPMSKILRRCDFSDDTYVSPAGTGRAAAIISTPGAGQVRADVTLQDATADTTFFVRLIEVPPPTSRCRAGNPGVMVGTIDTDGGGNGTVTVQQAVLPRVTGAWVFVEGPPGDFFSSDFVAPV